ncbi:hypothetical protein ACFSTH_10040 [Paenibacillus yanchengensis]|uniref:Uncharacterized protein n=1 Tax=Paenibacillus yanchengensis TaxID=2035833 RepID=A0ABW4YNP8_9BACL
MSRMPRWIKKHFIVIILLCCGGLLGSFYIFQANASQHFPVVLVSQVGEEDTVKELQLDGTMTDNFHQTTFTWQQDEVMAKLTPFKKYEPTPYSIRPSFHAEHYQMDIWREGDITKLFTTLIDQQNNQRHNFPAVKVPIAFVETNEDYLYRNVEHYGATIVNGIGYFTALTSGADSGTNIIYRLTFPESEAFYNDNKPHYPERIAKFPLAVAGAVSDEANLAVLGLESLGEHLYIIGLQHHNELIVQQYTLDGQLVQTEALDVTPYIDQKFFRQSFNSKYTTFVHKENKQLTIAFTHHNEEQQFFVTIDQQQSGDGKLIANVAELTYFDTSYGVDSFRDGYVQDALLVNDRLYYVAAMYEKSEANRIVDIAPIRIMLHVIENNELIYAGYFQTPLNDDKLRWHNQSLEQRMEDTILQGNLDFRKVKQLRLSYLDGKENE